MGEPTGLGEIRPGEARPGASLEQEKLKFKEAVYNALLERFGALYQLQSKKDLGHAVPGALEQDDKAKARKQKLDQLKTIPLMDIGPWGGEMISIDFYIEPFRSFRMAVDEVMLDKGEITQDAKMAFLQEEIKKLIDTYKLKADEARRKSQQNVIGSNKAMEEKMEKTNRELDLLRAYQEGLTSGHLF